MRSNPRGGTDQAPTGGGGAGTNRDGSGGARGRNRRARSRGGRSAGASSPAPEASSSGSGDGGAKGGGKGRGGGARRRSGQTNRRGRGRSTAALQDTSGFWGDTASLPEAMTDVRITDDPAAVPRSLGTPPLPGQEMIAGHYFAAVYDRAVATAGALAAAGGLIDPESLVSDED